MSNSSVNLFIAIMLSIACVSKLSKKNSSLMILVTIEMLSISLILAVTGAFFYSHNSIVSPIFVMTIIIIEATLGLTVLINMARQTTDKTPSSAQLSI